MAGALSCIKYSLAFLLGAMALGLFIILQLQRDAIRVEIHWRTKQPSSGFSPSFDRRSIAVAPSRDSQHPAAMLTLRNNSGTSVVASSYSKAKSTIPNFRNGSMVEDKSHSHSQVLMSRNRLKNTPSKVEAEKWQEKANLLLPRYVRQMSPNVKTGHKSDLSSLPGDKLATLMGNYKAINKRTAGGSSKDSLESMVPVQEALSRTAPAWVGKSIPPVRLQDVTNCRRNGSICLENLSEEDWSKFTACRSKTIFLEWKIGAIQSNATCHFQNGIRRHPVALASFPGSGNTWVRGMLQQITGICTGSLYCDTVLRARGFAGEYIRGPSVIAIKSHGVRALFTNGELPQRVNKNHPLYGAAVLLVRDPKSALVAEWHREKSKRQTNATSSNHYLAVGEEYFNNNQDWDDYVKAKSKRWRDHITGWVNASKNNPFLVVRYEDLKNNTIMEMKKMIDFLGFSHISEAEVRERLSKGFTSFYRNHRDNFSHYTDEQKDFIHQQVQDTINALREQGRENVFPIHEYL